MPWTEFAPAKVNLCLHVTGRRPDGYHLLDGVVVFPRVGDLIEARAGEPSLRIGGRFAAQLDPAADNLVRRAAALMGASGVEIALTKSLPVSSGIGGGSADAAATLRLLHRMLGSPLPPREAVLALGADVPVCLRSVACRMSGVGERIAPIATPEFWMVLVNPGAALATKEVFSRLRAVDNPSMPGDPGWDRFDGMVDFLKAQRNDLEPAAIALEPGIASVLDAISRQPACRLARMSGSGATCFGVFGDERSARAARAELEAANPGWWVAAARVEAASGQPGDDEIREL